MFDTLIEDMPNEMFADRPWGKGNNPKTAVWEYLRRLKVEGCKATDGAPLAFEIDKTIGNKLLITVAPEGLIGNPSPIVAVEGHIPNKPVLVKTGKHLVTTGKKVIKKKLAETVSHVKG